jgi:hypothetical protein
MRPQPVTTFFDHGLSPHQLVRRIELEKRISHAFDKPISLYDSTRVNMPPLTEEELISRLAEPDWIDFSCTEESMIWYIWATNVALAIDFKGEKYEWPNFVSDLSTFLAVRQFTMNLLEQFNATVALVAPSGGPGGGVAREFFCEAIMTETLIQRVSKTEAGKPLRFSLTESIDKLGYSDDELNFGYFVWNAEPN